MKRESSLTIGNLAKQAGVGVETIRFYERKGLIKRPVRRQAAYGEYSADDARRIRFIKRAQDLGFTLAEIKEFFLLESDAPGSCGSVGRRAASKLREIEEKIKDLQRMKRALRELVETCGDGKQTLKECRIMDCFE